jgi:hypothetical protein
MSLPPLTDFGWSTDDNILSVIWDTEANVKRVKNIFTIYALATRTTVTSLTTHPTPPTTAFVG